SRDAVKRTRLLLELSKTYRDRATNAVRSSSVHKLVDELFASPFITIGRASEVMGLSFKSAANIVGRLAKIGMLREMTGQERNRIFGAEEILPLPDEPFPGSATT